MENKLFIEAHKRWAEIGQYKPIADMEMELSFYKKMLSIFQIGAFYYFVFCPSIAKLEYASDSITHVLGYEPELFTTDWFLEHIHPDDVPYFVDFEAMVVDFKMKLPIDKIMKYKSQYGYRIRKADGTYLPILQQSITIQCDEEGAVLRNLVIHTDISSLKPSSTHRSLSFIGLDGEPSFYNVDVKKRLIPAKPLLTKREKEILGFLSQNKTTAEIATALFISKETVGTHRKNIHAKTKTRSVLELVMKALEKGWLGLLPFFLPESLTVDTCLSVFL
jgi:DNA-binding CsgD family transcriptional regulator